MLQYRRQTRHETTSASNGCWMLGKMVQYRKENAPKCSKDQTWDTGCEKNATIRRVIFGEISF